MLFRESGPGTLCDLPSISSFLPGKGVLNPLLQSEWACSGALFLSCPHSASESFQEWMDVQAAATKNSEISELVWDESLASFFFPFKNLPVCTKSLQSCLILCNSMDFNCPRDSPGKNTRVGCHALFQGIFPTQGRSLYVSCVGRRVLYH